MTTALMLAPAARSHPGQVRETNEDAVFVSPRMVAVADGVGGAAAGEVASRTAIHAIAHLDKCRLGEPLPDALARTLAEGNRTIAFLTACRPALAGMATTLTAVAIDDDGRYVLGHIGDSRAYLLRDGALRRLTRDDSYIQELIDAGGLSEEQARRHPHRAVILQALDGRPDPRPTVTATTAARTGDRVLVCSDGLSDLVPEAAIRATAAATPGRRACAERLVALANAAGGRDNITVAVADVVPRRDPATAWA